MTPDGIVIAALVAVAVLALAWRGVRRLLPERPLTDDERAAAAQRSRQDTFDGIVAHHMVDATEKTGRKPWL